MEKIFISIVNFHDWENTLECLRSLDKIQKDKLNLEVVVVDNESKKDQPKIKLENLKLTVLESAENLGFAGAHNLAIEFALKQKADYILVLNNDIYVDKNLLTELVETFKKEERVGIVVPKIYFAKGFEFHKQRYKEKDLGRVLWYAGGLIDWANIMGAHRGVDEVDKGQYDKSEETEFATGCCMIVKKTVFEKIGLFDSKLFLYYEDIDLSQRVKEESFKIYYQPKAFLWHKNAGSQEGGSGSKLQDYYITRNRLLFGIRYAKIWTKLSLVKESIKLLFKGRHWQKIGVLDFYFGRFGKGSYK
jgi:GT2 family glycosyltransferase